MSDKAEGSHADPDLSREGGPQGPEAFSESAAGGEDIIHQKYVTRHAVSTGIVIRSDAIKAFCTV